MAGEIDALVDSFAGEPELHHPVRGRIKGRRAFEAHVADMNAMLSGRNATVEERGHTVVEGCGFEEAVLHLDGGRGRVELPIAIVADQPSGRRLA